MLCKAQGAPAGKHRAVRSAIAGLGLLLAPANSSVASEALAFSHSHAAPGGTRMKAADSSDDSGRAGRADAASGAPVKCLGAISAITSIHLQDTLFKLPQVGIKVIDRTDRTDVTELFIKDCTCKESGVTDSSSHA